MSKISHIGHLIHPLTQARPTVDKRRLGEVFGAIFIIRRKGGKDKVIKVKILPDFTWDGMTIPKFAWSIVGSPFEPKHELAGLVHDWMYNNPNVDCTRKEADEIMLYILDYVGESWKDKKVIYRAVRMFGGYHWR